MSKAKNVFISHYHNDDHGVTDLTKLLASKGYNLRNSSIRVKPSNRERLAKSQVSDDTIKRLLRMKISWAGTTVVLIGPQTHSRKWVNWEIEQAAKQDKRIFGIFMQGASDSDVPKALEKFGEGLVGWNSEKIIDGLEGKNIGWCTSTGESRSPSNSLIRVSCQ